MNKLQTALLSLPRNAQSTPSIVTHVVLGYPSMEESMEIVRAMSDCGVFAIELQIPFSDPMADGPTIMHANEVAISCGTTPTSCMKAVEQLARELETPLVIMSYFNLLLNYKKAGLSRFMKDAAQAGATSLIVPDVPPEENEEGYWTLSKASGLIPIPLVSPVSKPARMKLLAKASDEGFVYCVATTGTTGARASLAPELKRYLKTVGTHFKQPRAVGFGISSAKQVRALKGQAELAIVGSAMLDRIAESTKKDRIKAVRKFARELSSA